ncbi:MAG: acyl-CoA dehydrogenase family protein [Pseudomonadota bacterium]
MLDSIYETEEHVAFRAQIRRFVVEEVRPNIDDWEQTGEIPRDVFRKMGALGFLGVRYPEAFGGAEMDTFGSVVLAEELGRSGLSGFAISTLVHTDMASPHLERYGTSEQKAKYLPGIVSGDLITAVGVTEPGAGSDVAGISARAEKRGNGWVLSGTKMFITNGVLGDLCFVAAKTDLDVKPSRGVSMFIVEKGAPGFTVSSQLDKMGWRCSDTAELVFDNVELTADALLGSEGRGFYQIMDNFQNERLVIGAMAVGEAERALEVTLEYVRDRKAFAETLWDKQVVRHKLAECAGRCEAVKRLVHHTAWLDAQGRDCVKEVSMIKVEAARMLQQVVYECQQLHGGAGYMRGMEIERLYRDARVQAIGGGASEVMLEEVAKRL